MDRTNLFLAARAIRPVLAYWTRQEPELACGIFQVLSWLPNLLCTNLTAHLCDHNLMIEPAQTSSKFYTPYNSTIVGIISSNPTKNDGLKNLKWPARCRR